MEGKGERLAVWFTGPPCAGKTSIARSVQIFLTEKGRSSQVYDGDELRKLLSQDLKHGKEHMETNLKRNLQHVNANTAQNSIALIAMVSPSEPLRLFAKAFLNELGFKFLLVYVKASPELCCSRDVKGLYKKALEGDSSILLPGFNSENNIPTEPDLVCDTDAASLEGCVERVAQMIFLAFPSSYTAQ